MAMVAQSFVTVHPSLVEPELLLPINQASGAFETLPDAAPTVKLGSEDLAVYIKRVDLRTQMSAAQSAANQLPSCTIVATMIQALTYLQRVRAEWDHHDAAMAGEWGIGIEAATRLGMRQGHYQLLRGALLYGYNPQNGEGLLNASGATTTNLPPDSYGNTTLSTYDNGQLAFYLLQLVGQIKVRTNQLGLGRHFTILMPQRDGELMEYQNIVQLVQYQRIGAGSQTTAGVVKDVLEGNQDVIHWVYDDTLIGKGANGSDAIIIVMPKIEKPRVNAIDTNTFATLSPGMLECTKMYLDMAAPREIPVPIAGGAIDVLSEWRTSPGWAVRPEALTILSAAYA